MAAEDNRKVESNIVFMFDDFSEGSTRRMVKEIITKVNQAQSPKEDIRIFLNSPGGLVIGLFSIIDTINMIPNDVEITCVGQAASCSAVLLSCGTKGKRYITKNSRVLLHQASGGTWGHVKDMSISIEEHNRLNEELLKLLSKNTGQPLSKVKKDMERDLWLTAKQALAYGLVDKII